MRASHARAHTRAMITASGEEEREGGREGGREAYPSLGSSTPTGLPAEAHLDRDSFDHLDRENFGHLDRNRGLYTPHFSPHCHLFFTPFSPHFAPPFRSPSSSPVNPTPLTKPLHETVTVTAVTRNRYRYMPTRPWSDGQTAPDALPAGTRCPCYARTCARCACLILIIDVVEYKRKSDENMRKMKICVDENMRNGCTCTRADGGHIMAARRDSF